jgi:hydroxymethylpyrimidine pyrophosphatase-like HAD family hydrolase
MLDVLKKLNHKVFVISGAEYSRMLIQCPLECVYMPQNGNEVYENGKCLWSNELFDKQEIRKHIMNLAMERDMGVNDDMIDDRGSQISFSFIGHHAPFEKKKAFDPDRKIRIDLLERFPFPKAVIGGTTCIDYIPYTKGQNIRKYMDLNGLKVHECLYVGDAFMNYGNDATVMGVIPVLEVKSPLGTLNFIKSL